MPTKKKTAEPASPKAAETTALAKAEDKSVAVAEIPVSAQAAAIVEGEICKEDFIFPTLVMYQGTNQEREKSWWTSDLKPGDVLDPNSGEIFNGEWDRETRTGMYRFTILRVSKYYTLFPPRNAQSSGVPIIRALTKAEVLDQMTEDFLAENGWAPGDRYDNKEGTYTAEQLADPFDFIDETEMNEKAPPFVGVTFEYLCLFEDGTVAGLRFQSRRDGKAGPALFTYYNQSTTSPRPWFFIVGWQDRKSAENNWLGLKATKAGLATQEHIDLHNRWAASIQGKKVVLEDAVEADPDEG